MSSSLVGGKHKDSVFIRERPEEVRDGRRRK